MPDTHGFEDGSLLALGRRVEECACPQHAQDRADHKLVLQARPNRQRIRSAETSRAERLARSGRSVVQCLTQSRCMQMGRCRRTVHALPEPRVLALCSFPRLALCAFSRQCGGLRPQARAALAGRAADSVVPSCRPMEDTTTPSSSPSSVTPLQAIFGTAFKGVVACNKSSTRLIAASKPLRCRIY